ncbi:MAG: metalloregulator ArsR/SmtB family transcription factor [Gammaproteobacteria bacterium]|nr:metalloregulator ArsR/SmtB family transcription factor [Gammaproteobacteria bacterium]
MNPLQFYKCLSDETRLRAILLILQEQELCVCELVEALDESQPKISRHLAMLRKAGLLSDRKHAQWVFYQVNETLEPWIKNVLTISLQANQTFIKEAKVKLDGMGERPARQAECCK